MRPHVDDPTSCEEENVADDQDADELAVNPAQSKINLALAMLQRCRRFRDKKGMPYIELDGVACSLRSGNVFRWTAARFAADYRDTISRGQVGQALLALEGMEMEDRDVGVRTVASDAGGFVVDLADKSGRVAIIDPGHVRVVANPGCAFTRPPGTGGIHLGTGDLLQSDADAASAVDDFFGLLGIAALRTRACILAFLLAAVRPVGPYPLLLIRGPQGSGKTTLARELRALVDPRLPEDLELPHSAHDMAIVAEQSHLLSFDNISVVDARRSDALCRIATGSGFTTRSLRTDRDLSSFSAARPVTLTSIGDVSASPDLLDRSLLIELVTPTRRVDVVALRAQLAEYRPFFISAVWRACAFAMTQPRPLVEHTIRMHEAASFAAAAEPVLGLRPGAIEEAFLSSRTAAVFINALDPVVTATLEIMEERETWSGSMEELLGDLRGYPGKPTSRNRLDLPRSARHLRDRLDRLKGALAALGVDVALGGHHPTQRTRLVVLRKRGGSRQA